MILRMRELPLLSNACLCLCMNLWIWAKRVYSTQKRNCIDDRRASRYRHNSAPIDQKSPRSSLYIEDFWGEFVRCLRISGFELNRGVSRPQNVGVLSDVAAIDVGHGGCHAQVFRWPGGSSIRSVHRWLCVVLFLIHNYTRVGRYLDRKFLRSQIRRVS